MRNNLSVSLFLILALLLASCGGGGGDGGATTGGSVEGGGGENQPLSWATAINNAPLLAMASSSSVTVAVGSGGFVKTSTDGNSWAIRGSGTTNTLRDIAWSGTKFVAVGDAGTILKSTDGISWSTAVLENSPQLNGITWSGTQFVAVGDGIFWSPDGVSWTSKTPSYTRQLAAITWTGTKFVAVSKGNVLKAADTLTSADGINWAVQGTAIESDLNAVSSSPSQVVMVGSAGIYSSPDGITWTQRQTSDRYLDVTWTGAQFVAVGGAINSIIMTSPDGITWTSKSSFSPVPNNNFGAISTVNWSGTQLLAVSRGGAGMGGMIITSPDGETWTLRSQGTEYDLRAVTWTGDQYVAVGAGYKPGEIAWGAAYTSPDGKVWTSRSIPNRDALLGIARAPGMLVTVGEFGNILNSTDGGNTWNSATSGVTDHLYDVTWTGSQYVAVGGGTGAGPSLVVTSPDGINWTPRTLPVEVNFPLQSVAWSGSRLVVGGWNGKMLTSPDGISWTLHSTTLPYEIFTHIVWTGSQFVAVGKAGSIQTSADGITWTVRVSPDAKSDAYYGLTWTGSQLVAVGMSGSGQLNSGLARTSSDGITWTDQIRGSTNHIYAVVTGPGNQVVATGAYGLVLVSP